MKISETGLNLIKSYEGCKLTAYKCPAGIWTIGWGHTGKDVKEGLVISKDYADKLLVEDMAKYEAKVMKYHEAYKWNQNEFDALTSFAYNVGSIDQLTAKGQRTRAEIAEKILQYTKGGGIVLPGLVRRRKAERELYLEPVKEPKHGWTKEDGFWRFYLNDDEYVKDAWYQDGEDWYWFDEHGTMVYDSWLRYQSKTTGKQDWYRLGPDGRMLTGLHQINGKIYYFNKNGDMTTEPVTLVPDESGALY